MKHAAELRAESILLTPYSVEHDAQTVAWLNTEELRKAFGITSTVTLQSHRQWIDAAKDCMAWAIVAPPIGHCGNVLLHCEERHHSAYFQIYLGNVAARQRGIGRCVVSAVLDHAFGLLRLHRIWLHTLLDNGSAERLYAGAGFVQEGVERESIFRDGRFESQRRWSILAHEWKAQREKACS